MYPQLKSYTPYDYSLDLSAVNLIDDGAAPAAMDALRELLAERGIRIEAGAGVTITLGGGAENAPEGENYRIDCTQDTVVLSAKDAAGQFTRSRPSARCSERAARCTRCAWRTGRPSPTAASWKASTARRGRTRTGCR